ncbi:MAG: hypothetical protein WBR18_04215 [Anaerolineales bacterium]
MNVTWKDYEVARARRQQLQLEADAERLTNSSPRVQRRDSAMLSWLATVLLRLGVWMVSAGCRLQSSTTDALAHHPIVARLELNDSRAGAATITRGC